MAHSEDVNYQRMYTIGRVPSSPIILNKLIDGVHSSVFYTTDFSISIDEYAHGDYSLMMVHPDGLFALIHLKIGQSIIWHLNTKVPFMIFR